MSRSLRVCYWFSWVVRLVERYQCSADYNVMNHQQNKLSHHFSRIFQADKIHPPRDFAMPVLPVVPTYLEIGAGKGMHALQFAEAEPSSHLYAVERTKEKFVAFAKAAQMADFPNLAAIHADAIAWAVHALPPNALSGVFILYPNPEPANANQRWLNMPFFEFLLSRVKAGGRLVLASNIQSYVEEAQRQAEQVWCVDATLSEVPTTSQRTHFEVKYLARGETCWQLDMVKPAGYVTRFD